MRADPCSRRGFLGGATSLFLLACGSGGAAPAAPAVAPAPAGDPVATRAAGDLARVEAALAGGRLGVAALDTGSGARLGHRAGERFAMCSTFKALLAAQVLARVERGELDLEDRVAYGASDLIDHAPVARAHLAEGALSIEALCAAAVEVSDNTAANLLLARVGGPAGLTAFLRASGDAVTRLDRVEPELNTNLPGDPRDTTTPDAMSDSLRTLLVEERVLGAASRARLIGWMTASTTGLARLRAGLPVAWRAGDKTGTSGTGAANDVAVTWPPGRAPLVIACFVDAPGATADGRNAAHAEVARIVARVMAPRGD